MLSVLEFVVVLPVAFVICIYQAIGDMRADMKRG